jgi:hypothetical protein
MLWKGESLTKLGEIYPFDSSIMDTYAGHQFVFKLLDNETSEQIEYTIKPMDEQRVHVVYTDGKGFILKEELSHAVDEEYVSDTTSNEQTDYESPNLNDSEIRKHAIAQMKNAIQSNTSVDPNFQEMIDDAVNNCIELKNTKSFVKCVSDMIFPDIHYVNEMYREDKRSRDLISHRLRNYTCADVNMPTSTPIESHPEVVHDRAVTVDTHLNLDEAKIWVVHDFITNEECDILMTHGKPRLTRATVAGENGKATLSNSRRAQQAGYEVQGENDPLRYSLYLLSE